jgi:glc operon protein GlcG
MMTTAHAQVAEKPALTLAGAKQIIASAAAEATKLGAPGGVVAVVDDGGNLIAVERLDGTFAAGAHIAIGKARTAALFKKPTKVFEDTINNGRTAMAALPDFTPLQGGVPIEVAGSIVGGVGVSGAASAQQDEQLALAGAKALTASAVSSSQAPPVTHLGHDKVSAAFEKGMPLFETEQYKIHASRRDAAGVAEVHARDTDIIYVLEGTATFVTGGSVVDGKTTAPEEIRGPSVRGGDARELSPGDVVVVPNGVPHWFKEVSAPFTYYVVKVRSQN